MCLFISTLATKSLKRRFAKQDELTFWKVVRVPINGKYHAAYQGSSINLNRLGYFHSSRKSKERFETGTIYEGIHVTTNRTRAKRLLARRSEQGYNCVIVKVTARERDLIAAGHSSDAVFMKIRFPKESRPQRKKR